MSEQNKPTLLVAKGDMSRLGGAERDLIRRLPHLTNYFDVKLATLRTSEELLNICQQNSIEIFTPKTPWNIPTGALANMRDMICLLYTSPSPRDMRRSRMPSSA